MDWTENYSFGYLNCGLKDLAKIEEYHKNKNGFLNRYMERDLVKQDTVFYVEFKGIYLGIFATIEEAKSVVNKKINDLIKELEDFLGE